MNVLELIGIIENVAPLYMAASWDRSGVQVAAFAHQSTRVGVMLDPTRNNLEQALLDGVDFILAHHPLSMQPRYPDQANDYLAILSMLLGNKAWLYSAHTSLDANPSGPVRWIADALRLTNIRVLEPLGKRFEDNVEYGFGFIGDTPVTCSYEEALALIGSLLGKSGWTACGPTPEFVRRIACCPGSGSSLAEAAHRLGADLLITGDVKYHAALDTPIRILDVGHFCLEEEMMRRVALWLQSQVEIPVTFYPGVDPLSLEWCS